YVVVVRGRRILSRCFGLPAESVRPPIRLFILRNTGSVNAFSSTLVNQILTNRRLAPKRMDSDRKYRQNGYMDSDRSGNGNGQGDRPYKPNPQGPKPPLDITGPRLPRQVQ